MDVHVPLPITVGLRLRGIEVITVQEDGTARFPDPELLERAGEIGAVLLTRDEDLLAVAAAKLRTGEDFATVIYSHQLGLGIGPCIRDLEIFAKSATEPEMRGRVLYLPL